MSNLDESVVRNADKVVQTAIHEFVGRAGKQGATVVTAPAGAGKTQLVVQGVKSARRAGARVAVATPTNEQAYGLVERLAQELPRQTVTFVPASGRALPPATAARSNVESLDARAANGAALIVGTIDKFGDAFSRGSLTGTDVLLLDESYQADSARYFAMAGLAPSHLLVGDAGQISPFSTIAEADRWRGLPEDPLQTAVGVLLRNHPATTLHKLPITRRLDARALPVARAFYPALPFGAAVPAGVRELKLARARVQDARVQQLDGALEAAARAGWAHLELPPASVLTADAEAIDLIASLVERLMQRDPRVRCERDATVRSLGAARIAVGVSHNDQKDLLRSELARRKLDSVVVDTANKLQGLEFDVVVAWHPLAGQPEADEFHLDPGRLCVLLTRHRHACIVVGRTTDRSLLDAVPPATRAYLGWDPDPVLDGWSTHEAIFAALEPHLFRLN
jgi:hypothetical protein